MYANRVPLNRTVYEATKERLERVFEHFERVCVSFSGGKDSTVLLHMAATEARRLGRRIGVLFIDLEAQYRHTIEHVEACFREYADVAEPYWVALPLHLRNAVSQYEPQWIAWEPGREADWVRRPPAMAITDPAHFPFFRHAMEFEEFVADFGAWYAGAAGTGRDALTAQLVGIRTDESLNRWRTLFADKTPFTDTTGYAWAWSTWKGGSTYNVYPIYDWRTEDIWTYHARHPEARHNAIYDLMHRAGLSIHQQRICQPYGDDQRKGLWLYHLLEPETWGRIVARVNGANQGALYAQESGNVLGRIKITRPEGHTWESFAMLLLGSMPPRTADHYRDKIAVFLRWWQERGYPDGIPDEADPKAEAAKEAPSWRRICKTLLRNDYWCKGLSFTQTKSDAYERYKKVMAKRRKQWNLI